MQWKLKRVLSGIKEVHAENIFIGNGSDEVIDLAYRIFCEPKKDNVIICPPTYGMYQVSGDINDVEIIKIPLTENFDPDVEAILKAANKNTKLLFLCSPNNPTGNSMSRESMGILLNNFPGIIIVDEAYINFSRQKTLINELARYPNLVVMQTLSKAWGLASLRLGLAFASSSIIQLFNKVKPPYNINKASQELALQALQNQEQVATWTREIVSQREYLFEQLSKFAFVQKVFTSDANFLLVRVNDADGLYKYLSENKIIVRNRSKEPMCSGCLRITIGTSGENQELLKLLQTYQ
jgi:histidinol-phosphate aminotransferase